MGVIHNGPHSSGLAFEMLDVLESITLVIIKIHKNSLM